MIYLNKPEHGIHDEYCHRDRPGDLDRLDQIMCTQLRIIEEQVLYTSVNGGSWHNWQKTGHQKYCHWCFQISRKDVADKRND